MKTETMWIIGTGVALAALLTNQFSTLNGRVSDLHSTFAGQLATQHTQLMALEGWTSPENS